VTSQPSPASGFAAPTALTQDADYYPGVSFDGSTQELKGKLSSSAFAAANSYFFLVARATNGSNGIEGLLTSYGAGGGGSQGIFYGTPLNLVNYTYALDADGAHEAVVPAAPLNATPYPYVVVDGFYPNAGVLAGSIASLNGLSSAAEATSAIHTDVSGTVFELGGRTGGGWTGRLFNGSIDEAIFYNALSSPLSVTQVNQIRSYLALKYGITLGYNPVAQTTSGVNYLSSSATTIWSGASNATYQNDVAGIGRDDGSRLDQRVAHSMNATTFDLIMANGTSLNTTTPSANTAFSSDQSFVVWGDNAGATTVGTYSGVTRMARVWCVQTTGTGSTQITIQVPSAPLSGVTSPALLVASDANFQTGVTGVMLSCAGGFCTGTLPTFSSSASHYFSFGTYPTPSIGLSLVVNPSGNQTPGTNLGYTMTFTNNGNNVANGLVLSFPVPAHTDFQLSSAATNLGTTGLTAAITYSADGGTTWTYTPVTGGGGAPPGYDRSVTSVRWTFTGSLSSIAPNNTGSISATVRIQ